MTERRMTLDELKGQPLEDLFRDIADRQSRVTVRLVDGREIVMGPKLPLKPLPELEGNIPADWKDALYARD